MLSTTKTLKGHKLDSLDGEIGHAKEFYFDDQFWTIRYLVADTGNWLPGRKILISPYALDSIVHENHHINVNLTKKQLEESPTLDSAQPVSRQFEDHYYGYYGWPAYWDGPYSWGQYPHLMHDHEQWSESRHENKAWDPHLRSTHEVIGYRLHATDGVIGHIEDFIVDDETWTVRYLIINTKNWWPGNKMLIAPQWINRISYSESKVFVNLNREAIKLSPEYTDESLITRDYETLLYSSYNLPGYWIDESFVPSR